MGVKWLEMTEFHAKGRRPSSPLESQIPRSERWQAGDNGCGVYERLAVAWSLPPNNPSFSDENWATFECAWNV